MKTYVCKHAVEAKRWMDTSEDRASFTAWFEKHDAVFGTQGPEVILPGDYHGQKITVAVGAWILFSHNEFITMDDEEFSDSYKAG
jgi:succinylarginine dihydrolase